MESSESESFNRLLNEQVEQSRITYISIQIQLKILESIYWASAMILVFLSIASAMMARGGGGDTWTTINTSTTLASVLTLLSLRGILGIDSCSSIRHSCRTIYLELLTLEAIATTDPELAKRELFLLMRARRQLDSRDDFPRIHSWARTRAVKQAIQMGRHWKQITCGSA